jgi:ribonucleoside-diphosphate reductase alpha chain
MTEQQVAAQSAQETETGNTEKMTQLEGIRQKVFMDRYSLKDASGNALEHYPEQMWARVARGIAEVEKTPEARAEWEKKFYDALENFQFVPGGRILAGAGSGHQVTFYNCYVIPSPEDSRQGILDNLKLMTEIMARGGGVGINLSTLRPRGSYIRTVNGTASGPCSWAQLYSVATGDVIQQGGCFGPDERIATDHGLIPAKELADRLDRGEAIQAQTHKGWRPFTAVFRNGIKDLYEVMTNRGYKVRVTLAHKMGVQRNGKIATVPLRELKEGDEILLLFGEGTKAELYPDAIDSITLVGPSEVFDFEVEEVHLLVANGIYTSNSRRGALMLMLDDDHPDIEEFITVKRTPGKIEHANLSVCISDRFMQAVKDDADWNLVWQGEVKKTVRARDLWDLICTSAWESAEPGVVFMDRYNKLSNTWYYENIRCVNPCVTGDTLVSTEHGYMPARDLRIGMNVRTPAGLKPIEKMYNNGVQRIYRVDFSDGGYLKCTADHKLKVVRGKKYEWVPVSELKEGDKVLVVANEVFGPRQTLPAKALEYIAKRGLNVAKYYDRKLGLIVGAVIGDGTLRELPSRNSYSYQCKIAFGSHEDEWYHTFHNLMADMNIHTLRQVSEKEFPVGGGVAIKHTSVRLECYKLASLLVRIGMTPNIKAPQKTIPLAFMGMEKEFLAGILDGLFSTDGSVLMKQDNPMLRFHTSSYELAQQVRLILLQFGIHARIYRAPRDEDLIYDGRSMYGTGEKYDVIVMNEGIARFYAEIGLSHPEKAARLKEIAENWHYIGGTWTASVVSVTDTGTEEEVFDLYEPETLTWITNGYCSLDCGEQGLPAFGVCNLGALNLSAFVENGQMNYERLAEKTKVAMRFLDNVVDATEYFIPENAEAQLGTRRTGLGTMGLADALIKMKIAYGSDSSLPVIEKIYATIRDAAYEASADYAAEKGAFPSFERDKYMQGQFIKQLPKPIQEKIRKHGTRNAVLLTQAPTGTTSLLAGVSSGIEPVYDFAMIRRDRTGEHILYHPLLQAWRDEHPNEPTPGYFVSSKDLSPEEHVRVQATIQKYTDSSISKTVNAPNEHTIDQVRTLYRLAYEMGCKGVTYYRDGSRDAVLTRIEDEKKVEQKVEEQAAMVEPVASIQQGIKPLPAVVNGYTRHLNSPEGKVNITINSDEQGPLEVFINVGKAGSDIAALAEALGRLISLNLRILSPLSQIDRAKVIAEQLRSIGGSRSVGFGAQQVRSMPDAVARALELHIASLQQEAEQQIESAPPANGHSNHNSENDPQAGEASPLTLSKLSVTGNLCPECGCNTMVFEEGCKKCYSCGHSEC